LSADIEHVGELIVDYASGCPAVVDEETAKPRAKEVPNLLLPDNGPTETLLKTLAGYDGAFERIDVAMRDIVDILRDRGVSWSTLGETLAVSRQAAWKRFG
jgi:hypothetical protein